MLVPHLEHLHETDFGAKVCKRANIDFNQCELLQARKYIWILKLLLTSELA